LGLQNPQGGYTVAAAVVGVVVGGVVVCGVVVFIIAVRILFGLAGRLHLELRRKILHHQLKLQI
jgi:hypothetical protein